MNWVEWLGAFTVLGLTFLYWPSPWPVVVGSAYVAIKALRGVRALVRVLTLCFAAGSGSRPMHMRWTLSVWLTEQAWEVLGVSGEYRLELQQKLGTIEEDHPYRGSIFEGGRAPSWISKPITITYEAWGESLERWSVWKSSDPGPHAGLVVESVPAAAEERRKIIEFWDPWFRYEDGVLCFAHWRARKDKRFVLFEIPAPTHRRRRWVWEQGGIATNDLDQFTVWDEDFWPKPTHERFECVDREKGFRWQMDVHDLRPWLLGWVVGIRRRFFRREVIALRIRLSESGHIVTAGPKAVSPNRPGGSTIPKKRDQVWVICDDTGQVDRVFFDPRFRLGVRWSSAILGRTNPISRWHEE